MTLKILDSTFDPSTKTLQFKFIWFDDAKSGYVPLLRCEVDGKPTHLVFDTGAGGFTVIDKDKATALGLLATGHTALPFDLQGVNSADASAASAQIPAELAGEQTTFNAVLTTVFPTFPHILGLFGFCWVLYASKLEIEGDTITLHDWKPSAGLPARSEWDLSKRQI